MSITAEDCKKFITQNGKSPKHSNDKWKIIYKYKEGNLILRDFSNSDGDILTVCEDEFQNLSFYKEDTTSNKMQSNWQRLLTSHFSAPCYKDDVYTPERMLVEYLADIQHGMQHNDIKEHEVYFKTESSVTYLVCPGVINSKKLLLMIDVKELKKFGYIPQKNQSGYDFVDKNWNWY